ncbi:MAG: DUF4058 family protein [Chloroflexi bacterium]|nr:DUF4058 family protein [Ardenticatenaceae bacterium]MBL1128843.1 DUF4058 family protein [Chloroflexota bacterium]NOG34920.1 DUF4058 family protein [Chloroflexota bacterium]
MPSPFPGMDPYLESYEWTSVHHSLSAQIARQLAPKVRPKYIVRLAERFVVEVSNDLELSRANIYPDVGVAEAKAMYQVETASERPLRLATFMPAKVPHVTIEIRHVVDGALVTAIEIISPTNKRGEGYRQYLEKRELVLASETHLLEIDLLSMGRRVPMRDPLPDAPYFVFLSRVEKRPYLDVWPVQLDEPLPTVPVPLLPDDPDVSLDLQLALTTMYDELGFDLSVDYRQPPEIPLEGKTAVWAAELLQKEIGRLGD